MARNYVFTWNNYPDEAKDALLGYDHKYIVIGMEVAPTTGTRHIQGYIEFENPKRITTLKKTFPDIHWESRKGTAKQASDYCKKEGQYTEDGEMSKQGHRSDLDEVAHLALDKTVPIRKIVEDYPKQGLLYLKRIKEVRQLTLPPRCTKPEVVWLWGKAGAGKTFSVIKEHGRENVYIKQQSKWWDGYWQQKVILIDDLDTSNWSDDRYRDFLKLIDRDGYLGETKGGQVEINSPYIYITCEYPPEDLWHNENKLAQIKRRLSKVVNIKAVTDVTEVTGVILAPSLEDQEKEKVITTTTES